MSTSDGFYFVHTENGYKIDYFSYTDEVDKESVGGTELGDRYHIAFFYDGEDGTITFDETFDAIFIDPLTYIKTLLGSKYYGIMMRKTSNSESVLNDIINKIVKKGESK